MAVVDEKMTELHRKEMMECAQKGKGQRLMDLLKDLHCNVNVVNKSGRSLLHYAAREGHNRIIEICLEHGADVNARNNWLETPLHAAAYNARGDIVVLLLDAGANPLLRTDHGKTARDFAELAEARGKFKKQCKMMLDALKDAEAKWKAKPKQ